MDSQEYLKLKQRMKKYENIVGEIHDKKEIIKKLSNYNYDFRLITPQDTYFTYELNKDMMNQIIHILDFEIKTLEDKALNI